MEIGELRVGVLQMAFLLLFCVFWTGKAVANNQTEFLLVDLPPECVVLRIYADKFICAPLDREKKEVEKRFFIAKIGSDSHQQLRMEKIGPLNPKEIKRTNGP